MKLPTHLYRTLLDLPLTYPVTNLSILSVVQLLVVTDTRHSLEIADRLFYLENHRKQQEVGSKCNGSTKNSRSSKIPVDFLPASEPWRPNSCARRSSALLSRSRAGMANFTRALRCASSWLSADVAPKRYTDLQPVGMGAFGLVW